MTTGVELRDIVTDEDRGAALDLRVRPDQERFVATVAKSFRDALDEPEAMPRMWTAHDRADGSLVGFVMISDGIPAETMAADPDLMGPYYLWRLLVDAREQRRGYGTAILDAVVLYARERGANTLWTSCGQGEGSPQPFYERYGFVPDGRVIDGEVVLRLDLAAARA